jgi:flagellar motor switch/type III secretory pathway protein FliN
MRQALPSLDRRLPKISAADARASRLATSFLAGMASRTTTTLSGLGRIEIDLEGLAPRDGQRAEMISLGIGRPRVEGRVSIDAILARALVHEVLQGSAAVTSGAAPLTSAGPAAVVGPLGFAERGILAGLIARIFEALGAPLSLSLEAPVRGGVETLVFALAISAVGVRGWAELEVPTRWLSQAVPVAPDGAALAALSVAARIEVGRTFIGAAELAGVVEGDAVVFDGRPTPDRGGDWPVTLVMGEAAADAALSATGRLELTRSFRARAAQRMEEGNVTSDVADDADEGRGQEDGSEVTARIDVTAVLAAVPVEVVAELGRIVLRGDEVLGLAPGVVLSLGGPRTSEVTLRVGDQDWAEGELVDVDGALAVRVTRVVRPKASR